MNDHPTKTWLELRTSDADEVTNWAWTLSEKSWKEAAKVLLKSLQNGDADGAERQLAATALQALPPHGSEDRNSGCWDAGTVRSVILGLASTMSQPVDANLIATCMTASLPFARRAWFDMELQHRFYVALLTAHALISESPDAERYRSFLKGFGEDLRRLGPHAISLKPPSRKRLSNELLLKLGLKGCDKKIVKKSVTAIRDSLKHGVFGKLEAPGSAIAKTRKLPSRHTT